MDENDYEDAFLDPPFEPEDFVRAGGADHVGDEDQDGEEYGAYGMFTVAGGVKVANILNILELDAQRQKYRKRDLLDSIKQAAALVAKDHAEIGDTDVREQVYDAIVRIYKTDDSNWGDDVPFTYDEFWDAWA